MVLNCPVLYGIIWTTILKPAYLDAVDSASVQVADPPGPAPKGQTRRTQDCSHGWPKEDCPKGQTRRTQDCSRGRPKADNSTIRGHAWAWSRCDFPRLWPLSLDKINWFIKSNRNELNLKFSSKENKMIMHLNDWHYVSFNLWSQFSIPCLQYSEQALVVKGRKQSQCANVILISSETYQITSPEIEILKMLPSHWTDSKFSTSVLVIWFVCLRIRPSLQHFLILHVLPLCAGSNKILMTFTD